MSTLTLDRKVGIGLIVSGVVWVGSAVWFVATTSGEVTQNTREIRELRVEHTQRLRALEREGSEVARNDSKRIDKLEFRADANDQTLREMAQMLARIDENVKALKERAK